MIRLRSIRAQLVLWVALLALIPATLIGAAVWFEYRSAMTDAVVEAWLTRLARETAVGIERELIYTGTTLADWAADTSVQHGLLAARFAPTAPANLGSVLGAKAARQGDIELVLAVNLIGDIVAAGTADRALLPDPLVGKRLAESDAQWPSDFPSMTPPEDRAICIGRFRPRVMPEIGRSPSTRADGWMLGFVAGVYFEGAPVGSIVAFRKMTAFQRILDGVEARFSEPVGGDLRYGTGYPFLFDSDANTTIAHANRDLIGTRLIEDHGLGILRDEVMKRPNGVFRYEFPQGNPKTAGFASTNPDLMNGRRWYVGVGIDDHDIYRGVRGVAPVLIAVGMGSALLTFVLSYLAARKMTRPLRAFSVEARRIASGDGSGRLAAIGDPEIDELADALNAIARRVGELHEEMDRARADAAFKGMARQVAHEIKNAIAPIAMMAQQVARFTHQEDSSSAKKIAEYAQHIGDHCKSLKRLAETFAQVGAPPALRLESLEVLPFLEHCIESQVRHREGISIIEHHDLPIGTRIRGDRDSLSRVILNVINNAVEAMNDQGTLTFASNLAREGHEHVVVIAISDSGRGIPAEDLPKLFSPNFSTRTSGTGLGLFQCRSTVEEHGGRITVESVLGQGATFTIFLPLDTGSVSSHPDELRTETINIQR